MRYSALPCIFAFVVQFGSTAAGQQKEIELPAPRHFHHDTKIEERTDKFTGVKTINWSPVPTAPLSNGIDFGALVVFPKSGSAPSRISLRLVSRSSGWRFLKHRPVVLKMGSQTLDFGQAQHDGTVLDGGDVLEQMWVDVPLDAVVRIAAAEVVQGRLGIVEFKIIEPHLEALRDVLSRLPDGVSDGGSFQISHTDKLLRDAKGREILVDKYHWSHFSKATDEWILLTKGLYPRPMGKAPFTFVLNDAPAVLEWESCDVDLRLEGFVESEPKMFQVRITNPGEKSGKILIKQGDEKQFGSVQLDEVGEYKIQVSGTANYWRVRVLKP